MPENRKYFANKTTHLISTRTEEGLPLVPNHLMNFIIWGILARAKAQFQVRICHFVFLANHFHMLLVVENPAHIPKFVGYVKAEIAHAVNLLLGRQRKTVWAEGYDSPPILTPEDVQRYIEYIYLNPAKANLVNLIEEYPGVSSWQMFISDQTSVKLKAIPRSLILPLASPALSIGEQKKLVESYLRQELLEFAFELEPFAWLECFPELNTEKHSLEFKAHTINGLKATQEQLINDRTKNKKTVIGSTALRRQSMLLDYQAKKFGRKMICICSNKKLRRNYIARFKELSFKAHKVFEQWKRGDFNAKIPPGFFAPCAPVLVSAMQTSLS